jgi:hypothetical protein
MKNSSKLIVCCATCHRKDCYWESKKECMSDTDLILWWSKELGYLEKLQIGLSYTGWLPISEFIRECEFSM